MLCDTCSNATSTSAVMVWKSRIVCDSCFRLLKDRIKEKRPVTSAPEFFSNPTPTVSECFGSQDNDQKATSLEAATISSSSHAASEVDIHKEQKPKTERQTTEDGSPSRSEGLVIASLSLFVFGVVSWTRDGGWPTGYIGLFYALGYCALPTVIGGLVCSIAWIRTRNSRHTGVTFLVVLLLFFGITELAEISRQNTLRRIGQKQLTTFSGHNTIFPAKAPKSLETVKNPCDLQQRGKDRRLPC